MPLERELVTYIRNTDYIALVARCNHKIVASLYLIGGKLIRTNHVGELEMKVSKSYRGMGIGKCLLKYAIFQAKQRSHISKIKLSVVAHNHPAIDLYQKFGFQQEGILKNELREITGEFRDVIHMGLMI